MRRASFTAVFWILCGVWSLLVVALPAAGAAPTDAAPTELAGTADAVPTDGSRPWVLRPADPELLAEVARDGDLRRGLPSPSMAHYFRDLFSAAFEPLTDWLESIGGPLGAGFAWFAGGGWRFLAIFLLVLIVSVFALQVVRILRGRTRPGAAAQAEQAQPAPATLEVAAWEERLERRLDRGDARGALEALWWSLAVRLMGSEVDPAWTSRELVDRAGRRDLLPSVRLLDRWVWGGRSPAVDDVRQLWGRLREVAG